MKKFLRIIFNRNTPSNRDFYLHPISVRNSTYGKNMTFHDLQQRLLEELRQQVRSGAATERGLARLSGISQPHLHNVLKGRRKLSLSKADGVLHRLQIDLLHLIEPEELRESSHRR